MLQNITSQPGTSTKNHPTQLPISAASQTLLPLPSSYSHEISTSLHSVCFMSSFCF